ncbi:RES family NAD+ phosphorylase [Leucobacter albus]|uniref:RES family NAD+ phosphorylase n=1 Tax=Leucobacter albus TaxID=272210 RepID=A0ABW3TR88_9MICO
MHHASRSAAEFNPGVGSPTRFAFFGSPRVPILYAAATEQAAIAETLLHDVPQSGGRLVAFEYEGRQASRLLTTRKLRLGAFLGLGLRKLGVNADELTITGAAEYGATVDWAEAAHTAGLDGVVYMSRQSNSDRVYAFFGDRSEDAFTVDSRYEWRFDDVGGGRDKLITLCNPLGVEVLLR